MKQAGIGRVLEDFQDSEALRIALGQQGGSRSQTESKQEKLQGEKDEEVKTVEIEHLIGEEDDDEPVREEDIAMSLGLSEENDLMAAFFSKLRMEDTFDDEQGQEELVRPEEAYLLELNEQYFARLRREEEARSRQRAAARAAQLAEGRVVVQDEIRSRPVDLGEYMSMLPHEQLQFVLRFLDEDSLDRCKVCNSKWRHLLENSETLWKSFCERTFRPPAFRPVTCLRVEGRLVPKRFGTWFATRKRRPHVRTETGLYVMKSVYIKDTGPPSMWVTDHKPYCEVSHYRYLLFKSNGEVLYASTPLAPPDMREKFKRRLFEEFLEAGVCHKDPTESFQDVDNLQSTQPQSQQQSIGRRRKKKLLMNRKKVDTTKADTIFKGFYTVVGDKLTVVINLVNFSVTFTMEIICRGGAFDRLHVVLHQSVYHREGERVLNYDLGPTYFDRLFDYEPLNL